MSTGQASGKVILLGEHAVVYGEPAIASALGKGCEVEITPARGDVPHLLLDTRILRVDDADHAVCRAVRVALDAAGLDRSKLDVAIRFDLPVGAGLGSSAALAVALVRAAFSSVDEATLVHVSHEIEKVFHGNPSGLDAKLAISGSLGVYTKADGLAPLVPKTPLKLVIADTGVPRSTQTQVENVGKRREKFGKPIERIIEAIGELVRQGAQAITSGDLARLGELMDVNQGLLSALSVSSPEIEALVGAARRAGALGAKLTGAGGGGCIIALAPGKEDEVANALKPLAKHVLVTTLGIRSRSEAIAKSEVDELASARSVNK
jgi:mevalonate kinase